VSGTKRYHRKKSKEWRERNKKLHKEYQSLGITGTFSAFKKNKKKSKSKLF
tara:strand:- start:1482 stop:1634 length:153 start_codon:yes stop_codon:yes gene_type:complete